MYESKQHGNGQVVIVLVVVLVVVVVVVVVVGWANIDDYFETNILLYKLQSTVYQHGRDEKPYIRR